MSEVIENKRKGHVVSLKIKVMQDEIDASMDIAFKRLVKKAKVQGFRQGKVPRNIFEKQYGKGVIIQEAIPDLVNDAYSQAISSLDLKVVDQPKDVDVPEYKDDGDFTFSCKVDVEPEVKLGKYKGLKVIRKSTEVDQEAVDTQLRQIQESYADFQETDGAAEEESVVLTNVKASVDGAAIEDWTRDNVGVRIGAGYFGPDVDKEIVGLSKGDKKSFSATYADDYPTKEAAGKTVEFDIEVAEVRAKKFPELNDAFAEKASQGQHKTMDDLTNNLKEELSGRLKQESEQDLNGQLMDLVVDNMKVEVPNGMVEREIDFALQQMMNQLRQSNLDMNQYLQAIGKKPEDLREDYREGAEKRVKSELALDAIAIKEKMDVNDEDLEAEIQKWNMPEFKSLEEVKAKGQGFDLENLRRMVKRQKTVAFILENAKIKEEKK